MKLQRRRPVRRFPGIDRRKGERDPYLYVLFAQIVVCAVVVAAGYLTVGAQPAFLEEMAAGYGKLLTSDSVELPAQSVLAQIPVRYEAFRDSASDTVAAWITELVTPKQKEPEAEDSLNGAGGWMGIEGEEGKNAPSSCSLAPISVTALVEPPVSGKVTSSFGYRIHPITEGDDFHRGVDIAAAQGSGIYTPLPGQVVEIGQSQIYGNYIRLDHGNGLETTYCHCETIVAQEGANLKKGELLALVGSTGISTGPHVHFEISINGTYYNPAWVLDGMNGYGF